VNACIFLKFLCRPKPGAIGILIGVVWVCVYAQMQSEVRYRRSVHEYAIPELSLFDQDGGTVSVQSLAKDKIVLMDFFYTRCKTVCPVLTGNFANFQYRLKPDTARVRLVSITIDPEHDSINTLSQFKARYKAQPGWSFLTGSRENIQRVMRAFSAYTKVKMGFYPLVFIYMPHKRQWVQLEGYLPVDELIGEYRKIDDR
jgi:protein SCO1